MSTNDEQLQDYLDGRMSADERNAFERRAAADPGLAERIEEQLELRAALREEEPLPPGFYTRTRAAFEARGRRRSRPVLGILSWEAAGLGVAAVLALALFAPAVLRDEVALPVRQASETRVEAKPQEQPPGATEVFEDQAEPSRQPPPPVREPADADALRERNMRADRPAAAEPPPAAPTESAGPERREQAEKKDEAGGMAFAPAPSSTPAAEGRGTLAKQKATVPETENAEDALGVELLKSELEDAEVWTVVAATPLTVGRVPRGAIVEPAAEDDRAGERDKGSAARARAAERFAEEESLARVAPTSAGERVVLIGPREVPFSCRDIRVETRPDRHVLHLAAVDADHPVAPGGCAVHLPADGRPVAVADPE